MYGYYGKVGVRIALEFNGCMHHGHACHYNPNHPHPLSKIPYGILRKHFDDKLVMLTKTYGLKVEVMWECTWKRAKQNNPTIVEFMATYTHPTRLKPRDSLFGGRKNVYKLPHRSPSDHFQGF